MKKLMKLATGSNAKALLFLALDVDHTADAIAEADRVFAEEGQGGTVVVKAIDDQSGKYKKFLGDTEELSPEEAAAKFAADSALTVKAKDFILDIEKNQVEVKGFIKSFPAVLDSLQDSELVREIASHMALEGGKTADEIEKTRDSVRTEILRMQKTVEKLDDCISKENIDMKELKKILAEMEKNKGALLTVKILSGGKKEIEKIDNSIKLGLNEQDLKFNKQDLEDNKQSLDKKGQSKERKQQLEVQKQELEERRQELEQEKKELEEKKQELEKD